VLRMRTHDGLRLVRLRNPVTGGAGVVITEYHPVLPPAGGAGDGGVASGSGRWAFPKRLPHSLVHCEATVAELAQAFGLVVPFVYSVMLEAVTGAAPSSHGMIVDGVAVASLGHGVTTDPVLAHPFYGVGIRSWLEAARGADTGLVDVGPSCAVVEGGVTVGLRQESQEQQEVTGQAAAVGPCGSIAATAATDITHMQQVAVAAVN
jgi:hypothetical protein